jgi:predicted enzyme related to lactoylglutathione lyase
VIAAASAAFPAPGTLASLTGALLGAIHGAEWLAPIKPRLEDADFIEKTAANLDQELVELETGPPLTREALDDWLKLVSTLPDEAPVALPDGREAVCRAEEPQIGGGGAFKVQMRRLVTADGQTIHVNSLVKGDFRAQAPRQEPAPPRSRDGYGPYDSQPSRGKPPGAAPSCGVKVVAKSLERTAFFYRDLLGLTIKRQSPNVVIFDQGLVITLWSYSEEFPSLLPLRNLIQIQANGAIDKLERIKGESLEIITPLSPWGLSGIKFFRCLDPDGNIVEVFSADGR